MWSTGKGLEYVETRYEQQHLYHPVRVRYANSGT